MQMTCLLVGQGFRPPAKALLSCLPTGTPVALRPEPDNPYDEAAVAVWLLLDPWPFPHQLEPALVGALGEFAWDIELLKGAGEVQLGYVAATGGKPLAGTSYAGNRELLALGGASSALLGASGDGKFLLLVGGSNGT